MPKKIFTVGVFVHMDHGVRRESLNGIYQYASSHPHLDLSLRWPFQELTARMLDRSLYDGVIVWPATDREVIRLKRSGIPGVTLGSNARPGVASVCFDNAEAGRMAFAHLREKGLPHIAYFASRYSIRYGKQRLQGYREAAAAAGAATHVFAPLRQVAGELEAWLRGLPKPAGVIADIDASGLELLMAARHGGLSVPDDVSVISIGADHLLCSLASPSLSSVILPGFEAGETAARLLDGLMRTRSAARPGVVIAPQKLAMRRSTDFLTQEEPCVYAAMRYIRDHAAGELTVGDILKHVPLSRRPLEKRFKQQTGQTLQKAIWHARLAQARRLLGETNFSMAKIAESCGFAQPQQLSEVFKRELGLSARAYRKQLRARADGREADAVLLRP